MGEMLRQSMEENTSDDNTADEHAEGIDDSYLEGYDMTETSEMAEARKKLDLRRRRLESSMSQDMVEEFDTDPISALSRITEPELRQIALDYVNAKQVYDGMMQRVSDDVDARIAHSDAVIDGHVNQDTGMIHPATMGEDNREVYIVHGNVVMNDDGTVDSSKSSESIIIRDAKTGKIEYADPSDVTSIGEPVDAGELREQERSRIMAESQEAADKAMQEAYKSGLNNPNRNTDLLPDNWKMPYYGFNTTAAQYIESRRGTGCMLYRDDQGNDAIVIAAIDDNNYVGFFREYDNDGKPTNRWSAKVQNAGGNKEDYRDMMLAAQLLLPDEHELTEHTSISTDGLRNLANQLKHGYVVQHDGQGKVITQRVAVNMMAKNNDLGLPGYQAGSEECVTATLTDAQRAEVNRRLARLLAPFGLDESAIHWDGDMLYVDHPVLRRGAGYIPVDSSLFPDPFAPDDTAPTQPAAQAAAPATTGAESDASSGQKPSALSQIPTDQAGNPIYEQVSPETAWDALMEECEDEQIAQNVIAQEIAEREEALRKMEKQKPKAGLTTREKIKAEKDKKQAMDAIRRSIDHWKRMAAVAAQRKASAEAAQPQTEQPTQTEPTGAEAPAQDQISGDGGNDGASDNTGQEVQATQAQPDQEEQAQKQAEVEKQKKQAEEELRLKQEEEKWQKQKEALDKRVRALAEEYRDVPEVLELLGNLSPMSIDEVAAYVLSHNRVLWRDTVGANSGIVIKPGVSYHTGIGEAERRKLIGLFASEAKGGKSIERLAEDVFKEVCEEHGIRYDNQEALNALIEMILGARTRGDINNYILNKRLQQAEEIGRQARERDEQEAELYYQERYGMSREDYEAYEEQHAEQARICFENFDEHEYYRNIADDIINRQRQEDELRRNQAAVASAEGAAGSGGNEVLPQSQSAQAPGDPGPEGAAPGSGGGAGHAVSDQDGGLQEGASGGLTAGASTGLQAAVEAASAEVNTAPSEAQKAAGNYKKGHVTIGDFEIAIENPAGSVRRGTDADGNAWQSTMHNAYGYIKGTESADGDPLDVFLNDDMDAWNGRKVFVVDQYNPDGSFDEHKVMLGFNDRDEAFNAYLSNYEKGWEKGRRLDVTETNIDDFKKWIDSSHRKTKAFADYKSVKEQGVFGNVYTQFKNKTKEAIAFLLKHRSGEAIGAINHHSIGEISLVWGNKKAGLEKIALKHPEVLDNLQEIIDGMEVVEESAKRIKLESQTHFAVVSKEWLGQPRTNWLLTAYEKKETPKPTDKTMDTGGNPKDLRGDTALSQNSDISDSKGNALPSDKQVSAENNSAVKKVDVNGLLGAVGDAASQTRKDGQEREVKLSDHTAPDADKPISLNDIEPSSDQTGHDNSTPETDRSDRVSDSHQQDGASSDLQQAAPSVDTEPPEGRASRWVDPEDVAEFERLRAIMRKGLGQLNMGFPPELLYAGAKMSYLIMKHGIRKFADYAAAMIDELGDAIRPHLKALYNFTQSTEEVINSGWAHELTPFDEVMNFDTANIGKQQVDALATAENVLAEQQSQKHVQETADAIKENMRQNADGSTTKTVTEGGVEMDVTEGDFIPGVLPSIDGPKPGKKKTTKKKPTEQKTEAQLSGDSARYQQRARQESGLVDDIAAEICWRADIKATGAEQAPLTMRDIKRMCERYDLLSDISATDLQELVERAMTILAREAARTSQADPRKGFDRVVACYMMQPSLNARDSERMIKQQYSTPTPFGYVMGQFVNAGRDITSVLEPSAGNGALTIMFDPSIVHVNDIDQRRLENLRCLGYGSVTAQNALLPFQGEQVDGTKSKNLFDTI